MSDQSAILISRAQHFKGGTSVEMGHMNGFTIWECTLSGLPKHKALYCGNNANHWFSYLHYRIRIINNKEYKEVKGQFTEDDFRRKGAATALMKFALSKGYKLLSDEEGMTEKVYYLWNKLENVNKKYMMKKKINLSIRMMFRKMNCLMDLMSQSVIRS